MKVKSFTKLELLVVIAVIALLMGLLIPALDRVRSISPRMVCGSNLSALGKAMFIYANDNNDKYPTADKWCDLLIEHTDVTEKQLVCYGALKQKNKSRCHYALNPNCEPNSSPDLVLLFDSKGGWNLSGGPELLTTENHEGDGCNILFNDGHVAFITLKGVPELKWKDEQKE